MSASCQKIDLPSWPRKDIFSFFSVLDQPFYSVCFRVDVTQLHTYTKTHGLSFYYVMTYLVTQAVNEVENLRYTIRDGSVFLLDKRTPSFTYLKKGSEQFQIITCPCEGSLEEFCRAAKEKSEAQTSFLETSSETDDLIYISCLPWFDLTCCTNERQIDQDDAIPASPGANTAGRKAAARRWAFPLRSTTGLSTACIWAGSMNPCKTRSTNWSKHSTS